ncbi:bifunctional 3-hydroxydecanoyl-ACP dehydratase/trans-2-decenoyl-ACP isomerase [Panacibacter ginsenosidivorans]|uniref:3-hydroxydecanoyl-[acyl-carrier-protein] dehydratase n=1 Tax=Panacibacter ginsenosidivorans TaxID=1813871 RepID=A0A5B8VFX1_9BACT|nr:bifunctional 3-hydroxydecanoyl-ACP dehydratase/trans-2-decenoyl-ACP isomerase [Panacibacter ginsenosidivorans]QEC69228.1 bifunctional 3-hydroxydecanoyl-ACP dehydratase/trans-2-decenoyl-ACP isomerase [Panacibacter ginsenosidivorans]
MSFQSKSSYDYDELIDCAMGRLFGQGNAKLPLPPLLMFDRIIHISDEGGLYGKGALIAELDIKPGQWFFDCHFVDDPVMPGCLGLDAFWQLLGFYVGWTGAPGIGRAIGVGMVKFSGQVLPQNRKVVYRLHIKRIINYNIVLGTADGTMEVDDKIIYEVKDIKIGVFQK